MNSAVERGTTKESVVINCNAWSDMLKIIEMLTKRMLENWWEDVNIVSGTNRIVLISLLASVKFILNQFEN